LSVNEALEMGITYSMSDLMTQDNYCV